MHGLTFARYELARAGGAAPAHDDGSADFGLGALDDDGLRSVSTLLRTVRKDAGDF